MNALAFMCSRAFVHSYATKSIAYGGRSFLLFLFRRLPRFVYSKPGDHKIHKNIIFKRATAAYTVHRLSHMHKSLLICDPLNALFHVYCWFVGLLRTCWNESVGHLLRLSWIWLFVSSASSHIIVNSVCVCVCYDSPPGLYVYMQIQLDF